MILKIRQATTKLDWGKAFDRGDLDFSFGTIKKMLFTQSFIGWFKILHKEIKKSKINGQRRAHTERGVRQLCTLSVT